MGSMATCASCSADLEPSYKFCIKCGTPVLREWHTVIGSDAASGDPAETIIRIRKPPPTPEEQVSRGALTLFAWSLGGLLALIAVAAVVVFAASRV